MLVLRGFLQWMPVMDATNTHALILCLALSLLSLINLSPSIQLPHCPMSSEKPSRTTKSSSTSTPAPPGDHRKRRRNRTTQSCLNCHASKRMCDRKRPACQRCTTLGLTGLCVYEVDDPTQRNNASDEKIHLRSRIAELEGVIREMKNKPHPRWAQKPADSPGTSQSSDEDGYVSKLLDKPLESGPVHLTVPDLKAAQGPPSPGMAPSCETTLTAENHYHNTFSLPSPPSSLTSESPVLNRGTLPSQANNELSRSNASITGHSTVSIAPNSSLEPTGFEEGIYGHLLDQIMRTDKAIASSRYDPTTSRFKINATCGCIDNAMVYNNLLELSVRLRKAVESLGRVPEHHSRNFEVECRLYDKICELDKLTSSTLGNAMSPAERHPTNETYFSSSTGGFLPPTISPHCLGNVQHWEANAIKPGITDDDSFMSWDGIAREAWVRSTKP